MAEKITVVFSPVTASATAVTVSISSQNTATAPSCQSSPLP